MRGRDSLQQFQTHQSGSAHLALIKLLAKLGLIPAEQVTRGMGYNDFFPIAYFANAGCFDERIAMEAVAKQLGLRAVQISKEVEKAALTLLDQSPYSIIGVAKWSEMRAIPLEGHEDEATIAFANPLDIETIRHLEFDLGRSLRVVVAPEKQIAAALKLKQQGRDALDFSTLLQETPQITGTGFTLEAGKLESNISTEDIAAPTVIKLVNKIFAGAIQEGASDIHISPESNRLVVRFRLDGIMREFLEVPSQYHDSVVSRVKVLCGMDIAEKRKPQDGRLRLKTTLGNRDLRISSIPTAYGEDIVARVLSSEVTEVTFESLGMPAEVQNRFERSLQGSSKVIIVTGPTGSGKTSTLYAGVTCLRNGTNHIITIEDPIEYRIHGISQIQVNPKIGMTFDKALRSVLRQDPDVVLVGEIRDAETAATAMQVAQTGHLVLTTLHTNNAVAAITRLRDLGIPSYLIASSIGSIMAQRLVRRLCKHCAEPIAGKNLLRAQELQLESADQWLQARGCDECSNTGFKGRVGVYSFLEITNEIAQAIREEKSEPEIEALAGPRGYQGLRDSALKLVADKITSLDEVERVLGLLDGPDSHAAGTYTSSPPHGEAHPPLKHDESSDTPTVLHKRRILLVDDDENVREVMQSVLEYAMFDVVQAGDGMEALKSVYEHRPELIVLDLMMPKMGGLEVVRRLRGDSRTRDIPILMLTAAATEDNELELLQNGADDFVSKTARSDLIVARINRLINR